MLLRTRVRVGVTGASRLLKYPTAVGRPPPSSRPTKPANPTTPPLRTAAYHPRALCTHRLPCCPSRSSSSSSSASSSSSSSSSASAAAAAASSSLQEEEVPGLQVRPAAWYGPAMAARRQEWLVQLRGDEVEELELAVEQLLAQVPLDGEGDRANAVLDLIHQGAVPLPKLGPRLLTIRQELLHGRGFCLLRGLPLQTWPIAKAATAFVALGGHIGTLRSQNAQGHVLGHVRDVGLASDDPDVRIYQTNERQSFHADSCDVVGLACLQTAQEGGDSLLCSTLTIWNELILRGRMDLAHALLTPVAVDRRGEVPEGMLPYFLASPIAWYRQGGGEIGTGAGYQRQYINSAQRFHSAPRLSSLQVEALDMFDALCDDPTLHLTMRLQPGDVQLVYNHSLLHDRCAFVDSPKDLRRHLLRLWLSPPGDRELPPCFAERFGSTVVGDRGGIVCPGTCLTVPLDV